MKNKLIVHNQKYRIDKKGMKFYRMHILVYSMGTKVTRRKSCCPLRFTLFISRKS